MVGGSGGDITRYKGSTKPGVPLGNCGVRESVWGVGMSV